MEKKILRNQIIGSIIGIAGFCLALYGSNFNWWITVGAFVMIWGNNVEMKASFVKTLIGVKNGK